MKQHFFRPALVVNTLTALTALIAVGITAAPSQAQTADTRSSYINAVYPNPPIAPATYTQVYWHSLVIGANAAFYTPDRNHLVHNSYSISAILPAGPGAATTHSLPDDYAPAGAATGIYHTRGDMAIQPSVGKYQGVYLLDAEPLSTNGVYDYDYTAQDGTSFEIIMRQGGDDGDPGPIGGPMG